MRDAAPTPRVRNWKVDLSRAVAGGLGSVVTLTITGWPSNGVEAAGIGLAGIVVGLAIAFVVEYFVRLHAEVRRLHSVEQDLEDEKMQRAEERRLHERKLAIAKREAAINAVDVEVWGDAFKEAQTTGHFLPVSAILARRDVLMKGRTSTCAGFPRSGDRLVPVLLDGATDDQPGAGTRRPPCGCGGDGAASAGRAGTSTPIAAIDSRNVSIDGLGPQIGQKAAVGGAGRQAGPRSGASSGSIARAIRRLAGAGKNVDSA